MTKSCTPQDRLITADAVIEKGQCVLDEIVLYSGTADPGIVAVHDGITTAGDKRFQMSTVTKTTIAKRFIPGLIMRQGIYLDITVTSGSCFVRWTALKE